MSIWLIVKFERSATTFSHFLNIPETIVEDFLHAWSGYKGFSLLCSLIASNPMRFFITEQGFRHLSEKRDRSMSDRSRVHSLKEACGSERLAPGMRGLSYVRTFNG